MAHGLILGITESGKTTLARQMVSEMLKRHGRKSLIFDPFEDPDWKRAGAWHVTKNQEEFLYYAKKSKNLLLFVDEALAVIGAYNKEMEWCGTRARHYGHISFFISQRAAGLSKTIRVQCTRKFVFQVERDDCEYLAKKYGPELKDAYLLGRGEYIYVRNFGETQRRRLFWPSK